jgi:hypothetical protein
VLALAGLERLELRATHTVALDPATVVPAAGQGALAAECRAGDRELARLLEVALGDRSSELAVTAERALLRRLGAGCRAPVGAFGRFAGDGKLTLLGVVASLDGANVVRAEATRTVVTLEAAEDAGAALADDLLARGAGELLDAPPARVLAGKLFLLPRTQDRASRIAPALRSAGAEVVEARDSDDAARALAGRVPDVLLFPSSGSVAAVGTYLASLRDAARKPLVAVMGESSSATASLHGFPADIVAPQPAVGEFVQCVTQFILEKA